MASFFQLLPVLAGQHAGAQRLERTPEPAQITSAAANVLQYDQVMTTKLVVAYGVALELVHRARTEGSDQSAVDLACGPGHYTLCLARYLEYGRVVGIDLSGPMVEVANKNALQQGLKERVRFTMGDITELQEMGDGEFDLASFTDAAHHMPDLATVGSVLGEMHRITKPEGLVMLMDLARLRTARLTERYVSVLGEDYVQRGLANFLEDFRNSMYAAWTADELRQAIPRDTRRYWCHLVPRGLPTAQVILGLPVGRKRPFFRSGAPWTAENNPVPREMRGEAKLLKLPLLLGSKTSIPPRAET